MAKVASRQSSFENSRQRGLTDSKPNFLDHSYFKNVGASGAEFFAKKRSADVPGYLCTKVANQNPAGARATTQA